MTLKDVRDRLSRMFAKDRRLEDTEVNHILLEDVHGVIHLDYMLKDDSDVVEDEDEDEDEWDYDDDSELDDEDEDDDDDESWKDGSDLEESY